MENKFVYATMNSCEKTEGKEYYTVGVALFVKTDKETANKLSSESNITEQELLKMLGKG